MSICIHGGESQDNEDRLELYVLGRLPASEVEQIEEHLLICDFCRDRLDEVAAFAFSARETLKSLTKGPAEPGAPFWRNFSWLPDISVGRPGFAMAGAVAVVVLAIGMYRVWLGGPQTPVASLHLTEIRGAQAPIARPARELDIDFGDADAGDASQAIIVNSQGATVWTGVAIHGLTDTSIRVRTALPEGEYFATLYTNDRAVIREYEFRIAR